jgi:hypothetical protein
MEVIEANKFKLKKNKILEKFSKKLNFFLFYLRVNYFSFLYFKRKQNIQNI